MIDAEILFGRRCQEISRRRTVASHAHVERTIVAKGEATVGLIELQRGNSEVEDDAVYGVVPAIAYDCLQMREFVLDQSQPPASRVREAGSARDCAAVPVDADDHAIGRREECASVAAAAEGCVDINSGVANCEELDRLAGEHGNMTGQSASDSRVAVAARHHSRAPCGPAAATREPSCCFSARTFSVASASSARKRPGSQI